MKKISVAEFLLAILVIAPAFAFSQTDTQSAAQSSNRQNTKRGTTITGCLTSSEHDTYRLVDQKGETNMVYSTAVHLDPYVGQFVTLVGQQSATPSTDTGTARPMPHFVVREVRPASGNCK
jgi:formate-dependent nitrite reductase cytochrome c552 subunit